MNASQINKLVFFDSFTKALAKSSLLSSAMAVGMLSLNVANAADIYVDPLNGSDASGMSGNPSKPYKTINRALRDTSASERDRIYLAPGKYREEVVLNASHQKITFRQTPRTVGDVIITGADPIPSTAWRSVSDGPAGGIHWAPLPASSVATEYTQLFESDELQQIARYPDNVSGDMLNPSSLESGYLTIKDGEKVAGSRQASIFFDAPRDLDPASSNLSDEAVFRGVIGKLRNNIFARNVPQNRNGGANLAMANNNKKLTWNPVDTWANAWTATPAYQAVEGSGYILDYSCLDAPGEWFYRRSENKIFYKPISGSMAGKRVEVQKRKYAFLMNGAADISLIGIHVRAASLRARNVNRLTILDSSFKYMSPFKYVKSYSVANFNDGLVIENSNGTVIDSSYIGKTWTSGISILGDSNDTVVRNSIIEDIGWLGLFTSSLYSEGGEMVIENNTFGRSGRFHLRIQSHEKNRIIGNEFYGAMAMGEDAGSISYTSGSAGRSHYNLKGTEIAYNIVRDIYGLPAYDTQPSYKAGKVVAFYMEDVSNYTIHHNLVFNVGLQKYNGKNPEFADPRAKGDGKILYMGPRVREMIRSKTGRYERIKVVNNTFWNYDKLVSSWHMYNEGVGGSERFNGALEAEFRNNLHQRKQNQVEVVRQRVRVTNPNTWSYQKLSGGVDRPIAGSAYSDFVSVVKREPFRSADVYESKNLLLDGDKDAHFRPGRANFRPIAVGDGTAVAGGDTIPGITVSESTPVERGAVEGDTWEQRNRVYQAGAGISAELFNVGGEWGL